MSTKVSKKPRYTPEEDKLILERHPDLASILNRPKSSIRSRRHYLQNQEAIKAKQNNEVGKAYRLKHVRTKQAITQSKAVANKAIWLLVEDEFLMCSPLSLTEKALKLGRSYNSVRCRIVLLKKRVRNENAVSANQ